MEVYMDNQILNVGYYLYTDCIEVEDKLKYLRTVKANLLVRTYIKSLLGGLYIKIVNEKNGYANEMVKDNSLTAYSNEATSSMIPFFKDDSEIVRGFIADDNASRLAHSWIQFNLHGKTYIFDPSLNIIVSKEDYKGIFLPENLGSVRASKVKKDLLYVLANGEKTIDDFRIVPSSKDINSSFYNTNMQIKGEDINKKLLTLTTRYHNN